MPCDSTYTKSLEYSDPWRQEAKGGGQGPGDEKLFDGSRVLALQDKKMLVVLQCQCP
jgi:hypothetical protein